MAATAKRRLAAWALLIGLLSCPATDIRAEQLPVKTYGIADGLGSNYVHNIVQDTRGFLWFCTLEGLCRFDGYGFITYGPEHGLPHPTVTRLLETRDGTYWVGTARGLCRFSPHVHSSPGGTTGATAPEQSLPLFQAYPLSESIDANRVLALYEDRAGRILVGTSDGLFMLDEAKGDRSFRPVGLNPLWRPSPLMHVETITEDPEGMIWVGTSWGLILLFPDGDTAHYAVQPVGATDAVKSLMLDPDGRVWIGHKTAGLIVLQPDSAIRRPFPQISPHPLLAGRKESV